MTKLIARSDDFYNSALQVLTYGIAREKVGQPMVRVSTGKLQLGVVVDIEGDKLLVAVVVPSRVLPDTSIDKNQVKCAPLGSLVFSYMSVPDVHQGPRTLVHVLLELCSAGYWTSVCISLKSCPCHGTEGILHVCNCRRIEDRELLHAAGQ